MANLKKTVLPYIIGIVILLGSEAGEAIIGVNWGRRSAQRLVPSQVVDLLLQNGVTHARVYSFENDILKAFYNSGINLTITIPNATSVTSMEDARLWVRTNNPYFKPCNIRFVYLGGYPFGDNMNNKPVLRAAINALMYLQNALNEAGHGDIKVTCLHYNVELSSVTGSILKPSDAEFRDEVKLDMVTTLNFLKANNAPFAIEGFPLYENGWFKFDPSFAFPDNLSPFTVKDINGAVYRNIVVFIHDAFSWALKKQNASDLPIIFSQVGWPTDGLYGATAENAERFFKHLLPYVASNKGTPMRPGVPIDTYVHALTDENKMDFSFTRHWGIYRSNGEPKYKIDLTGQGRDIFPTRMRGIMRMPERWCVFNQDRSNLDKLKENYDWACKNADCSSVDPGSSCGNLTYEQRLSYAFNMYFQFQFQDEKACDFGGLAYVTVEDPSTASCTFPVEVVRGRQSNYVDPTIATGKGYHARPNSAIFVAFLLSLLIWC